MYLKSDPVEVRLWQQIEVTSNGCNPPCVNPDHLFLGDRQRQRARHVSQGSTEKSEPWQDSLPAGPRLHG